MSSLTPTVELAPGVRALGKSMPPVADGSHPVYAFLGLPYAQPPIGPLRFRPPKPASLWTGDRDATKFGNICPQNLDLLDLIDFAKFTRPDVMSEDCLFLNVWTPTLQPGKEKAVLVFIHGGGFITGHSNHFHGTAYNSLEDVIVVTINYRINIFGFMTTGDSFAPGNYGLLDQIEALRWIQKNIQAFGGNPENVTIYGESAGAMSVSALLLSPLARGLFRRGIISSGSMKSPGYIRTQSFAANKLKSVLERMGCKAEKSEVIVEFLRQMPAIELQGHLIDLDQFTPVIDGHVLHADNVARGRNSIDDQVDTIIGFNSNEGAMVASYFMQHDSTDLQAAIAGIEYLVSSSFDPDFADTEGLCNAVKREYLVDDNEKDALYKQVVECCGDIIFDIPTMMTALSQSHAKGNTFVYRFAYRMSCSDKPSWIRADHGADLMFTFGWPLFDTTDQLSTTTNKEDAAMSRTMIKYWANFVRTGNPNSPGLTQWPKFTPMEQKFIEIDNQLVVHDHIKAKRLEFWAKALGKFTNISHPTKC